MERSEKGHEEIDLYMPLKGLCWILLVIGFVAFSCSYAVGAFFLSDIFT